MACACEINGALGVAVYFSARIYSAGAGALSVQLAIGSSFAVSRS